MARQMSRSGYGKNEIFREAEIKRNFPHFLTLRLAALSTFIVLQQNHAKTFFNCIVQSRAAKLLNIFFDKLKLALLHLRQFFKITYQERQREMAL